MCRKKRSILFEELDDAVAKVGGQAKKDDVILLAGF